MKSLNILSFIAVIIIASCSNSNKIKLVEKNFSEEVKPQSVLNFTFSQNMVPDSIVGVWSDLQYIRFEPETEGRFLWQTASILVFTPKAGFQPATSYTGKFTGEVFRYVKKATFSGDKEFSFRTPLLEVLNYRAFWEINRNPEILVSGWKWSLITPYRRVKLPTCFLLKSVVAKLPLCLHLKNSQKK